MGKWAVAGVFLTVSGAMLLFGSVTGRLASMLAALFQPSAFGTSTS